ncbi:hypothetical protein VD0002_g6206 [Verticillium dahliae]|nr:hypothetical protein VD0002_g6206 [Verticillium dahliae]
MTSSQPQVSDLRLDAVLRPSAESREQADALVALLSTADEAGARLPADLEATLSKQQKLLFTNIAHLRGLHRAAHFSARETKATTAEDRQAVDTLHLQLQNLYYEQRHLQGEIAACDEYDHSHLRLPLIPVEDFLEQHPDQATDDENALMTARIAHERAQRETLEQQRQELLKRKQKLISENKKRKDDLANLDKDLEKFIDAAKPIQVLFEKVA